MLNPFPSLLNLTFFAPLIVRVVAAGVILYMAHVHRVRRPELVKLLSPIVGRKAGTLVWLVIVLEAATGILLLVGLYTQYAAIVGIILSIRSLLAIPHRALSPFDRAADVLLLGICVSLLLTGAGAFAFDIPL